MTDNVASSYSFDSKTDKSDAVLVVGGKEIHVEKTKLAAMSPYFNALFFSKFEEAGSDRIKMNYEFEVVLGCVQIVNGILPSITNSLEGIEKLLVAADCFDLPVVRMTCESALGSRFIEQNPVDVFIMAGKYQLHELKARIRPKIKHSDISSWCMSGNAHLESDVTCVSARELLALVDQLLYTPPGCLGFGSSRIVMDVGSKSIAVGMAKSSVPDFNEKTATSDAVLIVRKKEIHVEEAKLTANSTYFAKLFSSVKVEASDSNRVEVDSDYNVVLACVQIIHGHRPAMTHYVSGLAELLAAADLFDIPLVRMTCALAVEKISDQPVDAFLLAGKHRLRESQNALLPMITKDHLMSWRKKHSPVADRGGFGAPRVFPHDRLSPRFAPMNFRFISSRNHGNGPLPVPKPIEPTLDPSDVLSASDLSTLLAKLI